MQIFLDFIRKFLGFKVTSESCHIVIKWFMKRGTTIGAKATTGSVVLSLGRRIFLKKYKCSKGKHAWEQFQVVF